jgi:glycosyltransferase involved in cell wall biosynthesis
VVISVGRLSVEKGLDLVLAAAGGRPRVTFLLAGDGPLRAQLERRAPANVRFLGRLERDEVASLHRSADGFVYAGRQGANTPYAVLEAMASGLPVVATTAPEAHRAMLADGRGIAVEPDDAAALASGIDRLLADPNLRASMGAAARAYVETNHAPDQLDEAVRAFAQRVTR